ncbi:kinase-like domain-containing protein [Boeremia exigua]|uniref:kinase-like domain-containing protein n=1 Tax=Boeremia exigua TaxID=749465 RepID=UPI001E8E9602|nr:kinase-like domain-containing protein [Boeremia exigua]KAH6632976.1 kinase-like domain-containing protein [Boeremia exigua]
MSFCSSPEPSVEYRWIDGVERLEMYEPGGYHPVMIDDILHKRYGIVDKLGYGGYSTIWLARDETLKRYVAVKIGISSPSLPQREIHVLRALHSSRSSSKAPAGPDTNALPSVLDAFDIHGPNGSHACYTLTPAQGNLKEASFSRLFPIQVARALAARLATAVASVHSRGFVHGDSLDLHLRNVLVRLPSTFEGLSVEEFREKFGKPDMVPIARVDEKPLTPNVPAQAVVPLYLGKKAQDFTLDDANGLILSDFGEAFSPATEQRIKFIFSESETQDELVAEQIDVLGYHGFPESWRNQWERLRKEEDCENGVIPRQPIGDRETWPSLEDAFEEFVQKYRRRREAAGTFDEEETRAILDLMRRMLKFRPSERLTIDEVLNSEWMIDWALPELGGSYTSLTSRK